MSTVLRPVTIGDRDEFAYWAPHDQSLVDIAASHVEGFISNRWYPDDSYGPNVGHTPDGSVELFHFEELHTTQPITKVTFAYVLGNENDPVVHLFAGAMVKFGGTEYILDVQDGFTNSSIMFRWDMPFDPLGSPWTTASINGAQFGFIYVAPDTGVEVWLDVSLIVEAEGCVCARRVMAIPGQYLVGTGEGGPGITYIWDQALETWVSSTFSGYQDAPLGRNILGAICVNPDCICWPDGRRTVSGITEFSDDDMRISLLGKKGLTTLASVAVGNAAPDPVSMAVTLAEPGHGVFFDGNGHGWHIHWDGTSTSLETPGTGTAHVYRFQSPETVIATWTGGPYPLEAFDGYNHSAAIYDAGEFAASLGRAWVQGGYIFSYAGYYWWWGPVAGASSTSQFDCSCLLTLGEWTDTGYGGTPHYASTVAPIGYLLRMQAQDAEPDITSPASIAGDETLQRIFTNNAFAFADSDYRYTAAYLSAQQPVSWHGYIFLPMLKSSLYVGGSVTHGNFWGTGDDLTTLYLMVGTESIHGNAIIVTAKVMDLAGDNSGVSLGIYKHPETEVIYAFEATGTDMRPLAASGTVTVHIYRLDLYSPPDTFYWDTLASIEVAADSFDNAQFQVGSDPTNLFLWCVSNVDVTPIHRVKLADGTVDYWTPGTGYAWQFLRVQGTQGRLRGVRWLHGY